MKHTFYLLAFFSYSLAQPPERRAMVSGQVFGESGEALADARVTLVLDLPAAVAQGFGQFPQPTLVTTDKDGKFAIEGVSPGPYRIHAERSGYLAQAYGARPGDGRPIGTPLAIKEGDKISDLKVQMIRGGTISGRVLGSNDEPSQGVRVSAARWVYSGGIRRLVEGGGDGSDDQGAFRITGLPPGRYYLYGVPAVDTKKVFEVSRTALPTFAPSALDISGAIALEVSSGGQASADIRLRQDRFFSLKGRVVGAEGADLSGATILLMENGPTPSVKATRGSTTLSLPYAASARADDQGKFEMRGLLPGQNRLVAFGGARVSLNFVSGVSVSNVRAPESTQDGAKGTLEVAVSDRNLEGVVVALRPASTITRKISLENTTFDDLGNEISRRIGAAESGRRQNPKLSPEVILVADDGVSYGGKFSPMASSQAATQKVSPGNYFLEVPGVGTDYYLKSVRLGGVDITHKPVVIAEGSTADLEILLSTGGARVTGLLADNEGNSVAGATVSLWPVVPDLSRQNGGAALTTTAQDGSFSHYKLSHGDYYVAAFQDLPDPGLGQYPAFLTQFASQAQQVRVGDDSVHTVSPKLIPKSSVDRVVATLP